MGLMELLGRNLRSEMLPHVCVFCGTRCRVDAVPICAPCERDLPWIESACGRCANPVATALPQGVNCVDCQKQPPPFEAAIAPLRYTFPVDAAIKAMKFKRKLHYVPAFADVLVRAMQKLPSDADAILPVPLHWRRQAFRGFNQAIELSRLIQKRTGIPILRNVIRSRATPSQSGLNARLRRRNLQAAFSVRGAIAAQHVTIVDDVVTTGETCRQLAAIALEAGAARISVLAIARASPG